MARQQHPHLQHVLPLGIPCATWAYLLPLPLLAFVADRQAGSLLLMSCSPLAGESDSSTLNLKFVVGRASASVTAT